MLTVFSLGLTLGCLTGLFGLAGLAFSSLAGLLVASGLGFSLGSLFFGLGLGDAAGILSRSSLGFRLLAGQFGSTLLGSLCLSTPLSLGGSTRLLAGYLFSNEAVNLGIQGSIFLFLLGDNALYGLVLFL